jgi:hypothetical protein
MPRRLMADCRRALPEVNGRYRGTAVVDGAALYVGKRSVAHRR